MEPHQGPDSFGTIHDGLENSRRDVLQRFKRGPYAIPQMILPDIFPEVFGRIEFRGVRRLVQDADVIVFPDVFASVPDCPVHDHDDTVFFEVPGTFGEEYAHCIGVGIGQNERKGLAVGGAYRAEYMGIFTDDMHRHDGTYALGCSTMSGI
jgi:hypothetical protein